MKLRQLLLAGAGALLLGSSAMSANAAPGAGIDLKTTASEGSSIDRVHYRNRRCWRHHGHLHCRVVRRHYRSYAYGPYYPGFYSGYGYGPSINLYLGGGRRHHRW